MQLGRYQILKQLATGDVANVLLARATGLEGFARHVVIKCIRRELAREERLVESFLEEARIAAALHHQNIVQVHDIGEQDGSYFFAMEYVHGEDVSKLLAKVRERGELVPLEHIVAIIAATAAGLHHAHEQRGPAGEPLGLVHLDVCPQNILLGYDGSVKLVDFGMAKAARRSTKTAAGALKGKASYMAPEQCCAHAIDRRTDTFALGIVLYELTTAQRLFKGANEFLTMAAIVEGTIPPPSTVRAGLPKALDDIVLRALARAPEARYQTVEDLREALERFAIEHELRASNKAFADYMAALFGHRPEPWHTDEESPALAKDFDSSAAQGVVATPANEKDVIARHAASSTAPIMIARSVAEVEAETAAAEAARSEVDEGWGDEEPPTTTLQPEDLPLLGIPAAPPPVASPPVVTTPVASTTPVVTTAVASMPAVAPEVPAPAVAAAQPATPPEVASPAASSPASAAPVVDAAVVAEPVVAEQVIAEQVIAEQVIAEQVIAESLAAEPVPAPPVVPAPAMPRARSSSPRERDTDSEETRNERPPTSSAATPDDDLFAATLIAPPLFVEDDPLDAQQPPAAQTAPGTSDEDIITLDGNTPAPSRKLPQRPVLPSAPSPPPPSALSPSLPYDDDEPPPLDMPSYIGPPLALAEPAERAASEHMYIGPPAPPAGQVERAQRFVATHRRSFLVIAGASVLALTLSLLALRSCDNANAATRNATTHGSSR